MDPERERIQADLRGVLQGDVLCDDLSLQMYASDASIYEIRPLGVIRPHSLEDVQASLVYAAENSLSIHPRGAGSGLAGESLGPGLMLDFAHSMRRPLSISEDTVRVQSGMSLARLNQQLNQTYVAYGQEGGRYKMNQAAQDSNAASMSLPSVASRTVAKAGDLYKNEDWDLVDAMEAGKEIEELAVEDLPESMQAMDVEERKEHVAELAERRAGITAEIDELAKKRMAYIAVERDRLAETGDEGFDAALIVGLKDIARKRGFQFEGS